MRGPLGTTYDRVLLCLFTAAMLLLVTLLAWRGNWASVLWFGS